MKKIFFILLLVVFMSFSLNVVAAPVPDTGQTENYSVNGNVTGAVFPVSWFRRLYSSIKSISWE